MTPPIYFRGQPFKAAKSYYEGMHRVEAPESTWQKIVYLAPHIGLTRVANVTGLDRIGIPVVLTIRPRARTISVSSGKGMTLPVAKVSGFMEALELHCVENYPFPSCSLLYSALDRKIPLPFLPYRKGSLFHPDRPEKWTWGWDLIAQEEVAVPLLHVTMDDRIARREGVGQFSFTSSSNGLASGNHFLEAVAGALYELIERDAVSCHEYARKMGAPLPSRLRLDTVRSPQLLQLVEQLERSEVGLFVFDCKVDTEVPVFMAIVYDRQKTHSGAFCGYGAHLDPEVALVRAITEAVQSRLVVIAGSRDDFFQPCFDIHRKIDASGSWRSYDQPPQVDAALLRSEATSSLEGDLEILLGKLRAVGLSQAIVFDLSSLSAPVFVVRVVVPGLEGYFSNLYHPGKRAVEFANQKNKNGKRPHPLQPLHFPAGALQ